MSGVSKKVNALKFGKKTKCFNNQNKDISLDSKFNWNYEETIYTIEDTHWINKSTK